MATKKKNNRKKNLHVTPKGVRNENGVWISNEEKKHLVSLVNSANRKRKRLLDLEKSLPRMVGGKEIAGSSIGELQSMGYESDMVMHPKTKSIQKYRSKKEFNMYIKMLEKVVKKDYINQRVDLYKQNKIKSIVNVYSDSPAGRAEVAKIVEKIQKMSNEQFMKAVMSDEALGIEFDYEHTAKKARLKLLKKAVNAHAKM